jgi:dTDP-4-dehydrorhamnose reductase
VERIGVNGPLSRLGGALFLLLLAPAPAPAESEDSSAQARPTVIIVVGAAGEDEFGQNFAKWAGQWEKASEESGAKHLTIGVQNPGATNDLAELTKTLAEEPKAAPGELWLVLIGHGTFDGKEARFNLRGPDLTATNLALML